MKTNKQPIIKIDLEGILKNEKFCFVKKMIENDQQIEKINSEIGKYASCFPDLTNDAKKRIILYSLNIRKLTVEKLKLFNEMVEHDVNCLLKDDNYKFEYFIVNRLVYKKIKKKDEITNKVFNKLINLYYHVGDVKWEK